MEPKSYDDSHILPLLYDAIPKNVEELILKLIGQYNPKYSVYILGCSSNRGSKEINFFPYFIDYTQSSEILSKIKVQLSIYKGDANINSMKFIPQESQREAYLFASKIFHEYGKQLYNDYHPQRQPNIGWRCEFEGCDDRPGIPIRVIIDSRS